MRTVFIIGALALAGLPILNGFWSKELVLEAGLTGGPVWMLGVMIFSAGLTACTPSAGLDGLLRPTAPSTATRTMRAPP